MRVPKFALSWGMTHFMSARWAVWCTLFLLTLPQNVLNDPDVFWHIKTGEYILSHGFPRQDVFSYTAAGEPWVDQEWLAQVIYAITYQLGGWPAVDALAAALVATTFAIVFAAISQVKRGNQNVSAGQLSRVSQLAGALVVTAVAFWFADTHFLARPHLFGMICLAYFTSRMSRANQTKRASHPLRENHGCCASHQARENHRPWALIALTILWSNLHGSFVLAPILALGFGYPLLALGCAVAGLVNPYGLGYYEMAWWQVEHMPVMQQTIAELRPVNTVYDFSRVAVLCLAGALLLWRGTKLSWNRAAMLGIITFAALQHLRGLTFLAILAPLIVLERKEACLG